MSIDIKRNISPGIHSDYLFWIIRAQLPKKVADYVTAVERLYDLFNNKSVIKVLVMTNNGVIPIVMDDAPGIDMGQLITKILLVTS